MSLTPEEKVTLLEAAAAEARQWASRRAGAPQGEALAREAEALGVRAAIAARDLLHSVLPEASVEAEPRRIKSVRL